MYIWNKYKVNNIQTHNIYLIFWNVKMTTQVTRINTGKNGKNSLPENLAKSDSMKQQIIEISNDTKNGRRAYLKRTYYVLIYVKIT